MARDDGFLHADIDTGFFADPKVKRLWRASRDVERTCRAIVVYWATVLGSWAEGRRVPADDAAPDWVDDVQACVDDLVSVDLLDADGYVPSDTWQGWFGDALARRQTARARWRRASNPRGTREDSARTPRGLRDNSQSVSQSVSQRARTREEPPTEAEQRRIDDLREIVNDKEEKPWLREAARAQLAAMDAG